LTNREQLTSWVLLGNRHPISHLREVLRKCTEGAQFQLTAPHLRAGPRPQTHTGSVDWLSLRPRK